MCYHVFRVANDMCMGGGVVPPPECGRLIHFALCVLVCEVCVCVCNPCSYNTLLTFSSIPIHVSLQHVTITSVVHVDSIPSPIPLHHTLPSHIPTPAPSHVPSPAAPAPPPAPRATPPL
eukprot:TRINITY_DN11551_c0_g1_i1.p2 TRINITY_DN11551_c0_g1~~TRINITY_DN11551_c0_g1_i1.p2  ORF type:complete len:119 (+),score=5.14 TRINITY_DN11551_c0_g1_i1:63-419(+)